MSIKSFSRLGLISSLVFGVSAIAPAAVFAADEISPSDSLGVTGTANQKVVLTISGGGLENFDFDFGAKVQHLKIADVNYTNNVDGAWSITAASTNNGSLLGVTNTTVSIPYQVRLGVGAYQTPNSTTPTTLDSGTVDGVPIDNVITPLEIELDANADIKVIAQNYTDTITLKLVTPVTP
ncbi:hypothetical protein A5482_005590 [Cyanobacterium sp. IPPAS B-1200]|uniref:hypothetical protein n=1 Tax=Cyanobacterium sp. IPPAS B-1200 TaxID=1562720 RepID=UPI0008525C13|nr:hypothetical protein [Cyanobacterium sp. IPPAS B-1200]OEJ78764.1 hypothetical protein A5482_02525 [Cyanobacterium sp. IPPAS B-1200]